MASIMQQLRSTHGLLLLLAAGCSVPSDRSTTGGPRIAIVSGNQQGAPAGQQLPQPLVAGVFDAGRPVQDARVAWSITFGDGRLSAETTAVSDSGLSQVSFTVGETRGIDSVRATHVGGYDFVTFGVIAGESRSPWPAEPPGFNALTDWPYNRLVTAFDAAVTPGTNVWNQSRGAGVATVVHDDRAPLSPPNVLQLTYPVGLPSGSEPWTLYFNPSPGARGGREFYSAFWWKADAAWQGDPSGINKITFWQDAAPSSANLIVMMNNQRQPDYVLTVTLEFNEAVNGHLANADGEGAVWHLYGNVSGGNYVIEPGQWYRIELYFKGSTTPTSQDGIVRWWATKHGDMNPTRIGDYTSANFDSPQFIQFSFAPTWGGNSGVVKLRTDHYWIDHVRVSRP